MNYLIHGKIIMNQYSIRGLLIEIMFPYNKGHS